MHFFSTNFEMLSTIKERLHGGQPQEFQNNEDASSSKRWIKQSRD